MNDDISPLVAGMTVERVAELQLAYPTFAEGISMAAQKICRAIGIGRFPRPGVISDQKNNQPAPQSDHRRKWI
jgi:hypothetical protein